MKEQKENIIKIILSAVFLGIAFLICDVFFKDISIYIKAVIFLPSYLIVGFEIIKEAVEKLLKGELLDEDFLMAVATIGAIIMGNFPEATFVMLFFTIGETAEGWAESKSEKRVSSLLEICPDTATVIENESYITKNSEEINIGDTILVKPGERIALDGVVLKGETRLDTSSVTGESVPKKLSIGDTAISGCINLESPVEIKVTSRKTESTSFKILELVKNACEKKTKTEKFITRFARVYTPAVVFLAVTIAIIPSIILGNAKEHIYSALTFLIVSCPCALVVSVPLSFFGAIGAASKHGIIVKGSDSLEVFANIGTAVFDKTGTITEGTFKVTAVHPKTVNEQGLIQIAASVEKDSTHPVASSILSFANKDQLLPTENVTEISGMGMTATIINKKVFVGNDKLMKKENIEYKDCHHNGTIVHIAVDNEYLGHIVISDTIKPDSKNGLNMLKNMGISTVMLSGDNENSVSAVAKELSFDRFHASLLPKDKLSILEQIMEQEGKKTVFVGDGINDAPVLARADAGIAMGGLGSDAAIESADAVIVDDKISKIKTLIDISKKSVKISKENIIFSISVKVAVLVLSTLGISGIMWFAAFADAGVLVLAVLNSLRTMKI